MSTLLHSYHHSNNTTMLIIWAWERCRTSVWKRLQKNKKEKNGTWLMFNLPLTKSSQQRKIARHCRTPMKSNVVSIVVLRLVDFTRFPANRDCLLKLFTLVESVGTAGVSCELYLEKRVYIALWLAEGVAAMLCGCAKLAFMLLTIGLWHRGFDHYIFYCVENGNFKTA